MKQNEDQIEFIENEVTLIAREAMYSLDMKANVALGFAMEMVSDRQNFGE